MQSGLTGEFLACGILKHGFARVRCGSCRHEFLLAFSCKCRYFCPSCHAKRLALWGLWLEQTLLAEVPHRQVVLTIPKRLRPYFLYHRSLLGDLSRVSARTVTSFIRATVGEKDLSVGIISSIQTHGSLANWHPHLHLMVTDGGFRPDGSFLRLPFHDVAVLTEAFRRAVLKLFVRRELIDIDTAQSMLAWPHSGFHVHEALLQSDGDDGSRIRAQIGGLLRNTAREKALNVLRKFRPDLGWYVWHQILRVTEDRFNELGEDVLATFRDRVHLSNYLDVTRAHSTT